MESVIQPTAATKEEGDREHVTKLKELLRQKQISPVYFGLVLLLPVMLQATVAASLLIPFIGDLVSSIWKVLVLWLWIVLGSQFGEIMWGRRGAARAAVALYSLCVVTLTFVSTYAVGYYTVPIGIRRQMDLTPEQRTVATYAFVASAVRERIRAETGFGGIAGHAIFAERQHLSREAFGEFVGSQYEEAGQEGEEGAFLTATINVLLYSIPVVMKFALSDKLHWVREPGLIGLSFWYVLTLLLVYIGYRGATKTRVREVWNLEAKRHGFFGVDPEAPASDFL
jgi:hypothetical protein